MIFTNTGLTKNNIVFDFDISNIKSYDNNTGFTITSLTFWDKYALSNITLTGYGQTMYDFGLTTSYTESKTYTIKDRNLIFNRIGYNDASGNTTYPQIILQTATTEGNSFILNGGYLTSFFKIPQKIYELGPYRNGVGFTIDTWLYLDENTFNNITSYSDGFFLYFGTKAENKFNIKYSASTDNLGTGFTYDTNSHLNDIEYNSLGFKFNNDKTISIRYLGISGLSEEIITDKGITTTGWTNIVTTFRYCNKIITNCDNSNDELIDCVPQREGNLKIFVNGKLFFEKDCVEEFFWLKELNTDSDKQIGLPYSINWGGGSWGLKHSFFPSITSVTEITSVTTSYTYTLTSNTNFITVGDNGTFETSITGLTTDVVDGLLESSSTQTYSGNTSLKLILNPSAITYDTGTTIITGYSYASATNLIVDGDNGTFQLNINGISTSLENASLGQIIAGGNNYLRLFSSSTNTPTYNVSGFVVFDTPITLSSSTRYIFSGQVNPNNSFTNINPSDIYISLGFYSGIENQFNTINSVVFTSSTANTFSNLIYEFETPSGLTETSQTLSIKFNSLSVFSGSNYDFYFDNFQLLDATPQTGNPVTSIFNLPDGDYLLKFNTLIINPNSKYTYEGYFYDANSWTGNNKSLYLTFDPPLDSELTILTSVTYTSDNSANTWNKLLFEFTTPSAITSSSSYTPSIQVDYKTNILYNYEFYFDEFKINEYTLTANTGLTNVTYNVEYLLNKDVESVIKDNFDGSFYGKIQKLRMYDVDLDFTEVKKNYNYHSTKYGFTKLK